MRRNRDFRRVNWGGGSANDEFVNAALYQDRRVHRRLVVSRGVGGSISVGRRTYTM